MVVGSALLSAQMIPVYQVVVDKDPVSVNVIVSDTAGRTVTGLTKEDFSVLEDDEIQSIREIKPVGIPYNILVLVDRSVREKKSPWPDVILKSVDRFFKNMRGPDRLAVGLFDTRVSVVMDWRRSRNGIRQNVLISSSVCSDDNFFLLLLFIICFFLISAFFPALTYPESPAQQA